MIYGFAEAEPRFGWVRREERRTKLLLWERELIDGGRDLFFLAPAEGLALYDSPGGERVRLEPAPVDDPRGGSPGNSVPDHRLEPLEVAGRWMKVRVVMPDYSCQPAEGPTSERTAWIEYLDERGRPRVWYYTRGC